MKIHQKLTTVAGWMMTFSLSLGGCTTHDETDQPLVLCALAKVANLSVSFSPQLGFGTYTLVLETPDGTSECVNTFGASSSESCSGDVDIMGFSEGGFWVYGTPTEVNVFLEHHESAQRFEQSVHPEYVEMSDYPEECPLPFAELTIEPVGMPAAQTD